MFKFTKKMVAIHIIQNVPPSNLNRDDNGAPKDARFGGTMRARLSSQSQKAAVRKVFMEEDRENTGVCTRYPATSVAAHVAGKLGLGLDEVQDKVICGLKNCAALNIGFDKKTGKFNEKLPAMVKLSQNEIRAFADIIVEYWDQIDPKKEAANAAASDKKASKDASSEAQNIDDVASQDKNLSGYAKEMAKKMKDVMERPDVEGAKDTALFGRMMASAPGANIDAACQVAHAISTNEVMREFDFFTATDDNNPRDTVAGGMMGTMEFNSSCFYRYANVNIPLLSGNLASDNDMALDCLTEFLEKFALTLPGGKQNSYAAHTPPAFVAIVLQENRAPLNMANAFEKAIQEDQEGEASISDKSVQAFVDFERIANTAMCSRKDRAKPEVFAINMSKAQMPSNYKMFSSLADMIDGVAAALKG